MAKAKMGRTPSPETAQHKQRVVALRRESKTWADIGSIVGLSPNYCAELYRAALAEVPAADVAAARAEECALAEDAIAGLIEVARAPSASYRERTEAWDGIRKWSEHRAKMLGTNAPLRTQVSFEQDAVNEEIERLSRELELYDR